MDYCEFMHWEIPLFLHDSTYAYTTRQRNVHYVYHNVVVAVAFPIGCPTSIAPEEYSSDQKGGL